MNHLTDLQLDRLRCAPAADPETICQVDHLRVCRACQSRLSALDDVALSAGDEILAALDRAERNAAQGTPGHGRFLAKAALAAAATAVLLVAILLGRADRADPQTARVKGSPRIELLAGAGNTLDEVVSGQTLRIRLGGLPPPRSLILADSSDGSVGLLWPLPGDVPAGPGDLVELTFQASPPAGELEFVLLSGPEPIPASRAMELTGAFLRDPGAPLPDGIHAARQTLTVRLP